jgi:2,4-dienoyl-CoA reductase-like NADH-dependent reductase (Old Yellow Enzyme family)
MTASSPWAPLELNCGSVLRNRFILAPMTTDSSNHDGTVSEGELAYITRRCLNEFAAGITSCAYVEDDGRAWRSIGAARASQLESLCAVAAAFHAGGGMAILQLYDGGRLADPNVVAPERLRAPSAIPSVRPGALTPRPMTGHEVEMLLQSFVRAARLGEEAGFDGIELHGANHYLIHQFFSPRSNLREDGWGGSPDNRMRFPLEVTAAIRQAMNRKMIVGYRINAFEAETGGYSIDDAAVLCSRLCDVGVDYVHISMDDFRKSPMREDRDWTASTKRVEPGNPIRVLSDAVNGRAAIVASGGIKSHDDTQAAMSAGATLLAVGRASLIDPEWLAKIGQKNPVAIREALPATRAQIETELTIPAPMVRYILSRPGWMPRQLVVPAASRTSGPR